jgi:hypothetical protein
VLQAGQQGVFVVGECRIAFEYDDSRQRLIVREIRYLASEERTRMQTRTTGNSVDFRSWNETGIAQLEDSRSVQAKPMLGGLHHER